MASGQNCWWSFKRNPNHGYWKKNTQMHTPHISTEHILSSPLHPSLTAKIFVLVRVEKFWFGHRCSMLTRVPIWIKTDSFTFVHNVFRSQKVQTLVRKFGLNHGPKHTAKNKQEWQRTKHRTGLKWPPVSYYLNPIEHTVCAKRRMSSGESTLQTWDRLNRFCPGQFYYFYYFLK